MGIEKEKALDEFKKKYVEGRFYEESHNIYKKFKSKKSSIKEEIISAFKQGCRGTLKSQNKGAKGDIKYIYISYSKTGVKENKTTYRIDYFDDRWFMDKEECAANFDMGFVYKPLFKHMEELKKKVKEYGRTITEVDIENIKLNESVNYNKIAVNILDSIKDEFMVCDEYKEMKKNDKIKIFAGEYKGLVKVLYENSPLEIELR